MNKFTSLLLTLLCATAFGDEPAIIGSHQADAIDNDIHVRAGNPPWVKLSVKDAPEGATQSWTGPIGEGQVGVPLADGVGVATPQLGTFTFKCLIQKELPGKDYVRFLEATVVVEGNVPIPVPPLPPGPIPPGPVPVPTDFASQLTAAVKAALDQKGFDSVANTYAKVADQIRGGSPLTKTPEQVKGLTSMMTSFAAPQWGVIDAAAVQPYLATLSLTRSADYEPVWRMIAAAIKAGLGPQPPPGPTPEPNPPGPTPPGPAPIPVSELRVLILYDDKKPIPPAQQGVIDSAPFKVWMKEQGVNYRIWPLTNLDTSMADSGWQKAVANREGSGPTWFLVSNGTTGSKGPVPLTLDEAKAAVLKIKAM